MFDLDSKIKDIILYLLNYCTPSYACEGGIDYKFDIPGFETDVTLTAIRFTKENELFNVDKYNNKITVVDRTDFDKPTTDQGPIVGFSVNIEYKKYYYCHFEREELARLLTMYENEINEYNLKIVSDLHTRLVEIADNNA